MEIIKNAIALVNDSLDFPLVNIVDSLYSSIDFWQRSTPSPSTPCKANTNRRAMIVIFPKDRTWNLEPHGRSKKWFHQITQWTFECHEEQIYQECLAYICSTKISIPIYTEETDEVVRGTSEYGNFQIGWKSPPPSLSLISKEQSMAISTTRDKSSSSVKN